MELLGVHERIDQALSDNRRYETIVLIMAVALFSLGLVVIGVAYWRLNAYVGGAAVVVEALLYWPIREILKLRRDNLVFQTLHVMVSQFPPRQAQLAIEKVLFEKLWK